VFFFFVAASRSALPSRELTDMICSTTITTTVLRRNNECDWHSENSGAWIVMPITIFHTENGSTEKRLDVNDDGTVTYYERIFGLSTLPGETEPRKRNMTAEQAKSDWSFYAKDIDEASWAIASRRGRLSN
jgi:hypothetical protein